MMCSADRAKETSQVSFLRCQRTSGQRFHVLTRPLDHSTDWAASTWRISKSAIFEGFGAQHDDDNRDWKSPRICFHDTVETTMSAIRSLSG
jgi:hypothetical protein